MRKLYIHNEMIKPRKVVKQIVSKDPKSKGKIISKESIIEEDQIEEDEQEDYEVDNFEDLLILMTDVAYYIPDDDFYQITEFLNPGTVIVGSMHIPKKLTTEPQVLTYSGANEGILRLVPTDDTYEDAKLAGMINPNHTDMYMYTKGNKLAYHHPLKFPYLANNDDYLIPQNTKKLYPFLLKVHVHQRIDTGATDYIRFSITKEVYNEDNIKDYFINKAHLHTYTTNEQFHKHRIDIQNEWNKSIRNKVGDTAYLYNLIDPKPENLMVKMHGTAPNEIEVEGLQEPLQIEEPEEKAHIEKDCDGSYILYTRRDGRLFNYYEQLKTNAQFLRDIKGTKISPSLINKVQVKLHNLEKIDRENLIAVLTYINKEDPMLSVNDAAIPLLANCIKDVFNASVQMKLMEKWKKIDWINRFKTGKVDIKPESLWAAIKQKKAITYMSIALRSALRINPAIKDDITGLDQGF
jgi:hypothetical protein